MAVDFNGNMFPPYVETPGILMVTAGCLAVGSLLTTLASYLRPGHVHSFQWIFLILSGFLYPYDLARNGTELDPLRLAGRSSYGSSIGSLLLLHLLSFYLGEDLIADAKTNSCEKEDVPRRKNRADKMFLVANLVHSTSMLQLSSWKDPSSSPGLLGVGLYVAWVLARVAAIKANIATFHAVFSTDLTTPCLSVIGHTIVVIYACVIAQIPLELGAIIFKARGLVMLSMVSMQVGFAAMLLVYNLRIWHRRAAKPLPNEKPHEILQDDKSLQDC
ncbi:unnamed protein product, partial [Clonostachys solani]